MGGIDNARMPFATRRKTRVPHEADEECEFREIQYSEFNVAHGVIALLPWYHLNPPSRDKAFLTKVRDAAFGVRGEV